MLFLFKKKGHEVLKWKYKSHQTTCWSISAIRTHAHNNVNIYDLDLHVYCRKSADFTSYAVKMLWGVHTFGKIVNKKHWHRFDVSISFFSLSFFWAQVLFAHGPVSHMYINKATWFSHEVSHVVHSHVFDTRTRTKTLTKCDNCSVCTMKIRRASKLLLTWKWQASNLLT